MIEPWNNINILPHERSYIKRQGYFNEDYFKLARKFNLKIIYASSDFPQKIPFKVAAVLFKKIN